MNTDKYPIGEMKAAILSGDGYHKVGDRFGLSSAFIHRLLRDDPDIVAAKANGTLRAPKRHLDNLRKQDYLALPYVQDVLERGMSTSAAARKHGISQSVVWTKVQAAKKILEARPTPPTPPPAPPAPDADVSLILQMAQALATSHNTTARALLERTLQSLPT